MKFKLTKNHIQNLLKFGMFLGVAIVILQLFPSQPHKSDEQREREHWEGMRSLTPHFEFDTEAASVQFQKFVTDFQNRNGRLPAFHDLIERKFNQIYSVGIISAKGLIDLLSIGVQNAYCVFPDGTTHLIPLSSFFTPETAHDEILRVVSDFERNLLRSYNLNLYLVGNVRIIDDVGVHIYSIKGYHINLPPFSNEISLIGKILIVLGFISLLFAYFYLFRPRMYDSYGNLILVLVLVLLISALAAFAVRFQSEAIHYYMIPYALIPIIIRVFFDSKTALYTHVVTSVIVSFMVDAPFQFLVLQIAVGIFVVLSLKDLAQRSQLFQTAFYIFLCYTITYLATVFVAEGNFNQISWFIIICFAVSSTLLLLAYVLIYLFEKIFGLISSVTLIELTNINSDLMMKFSESAPGTFQHSLQVSNLATEAAKKIGANTLLVRTGALYHDIGKMKNPGFFTENQLGGKNPLLEKDFEEAAQIIISHVSDGIQIAKKHHLPEQIINFIGTHHGESKVRYFYNSFINANPDVKPNDAAFTYPGPLPTSKETAILMMADAVEARSRSLPEYTEKTIRDMVEDMIDMQIAEGQLKDAPITFQDVETVKQVFTQKLINIYHTRIAYPKTV